MILFLGAGGNHQAPSDGDTVNPRMSPQVCLDGGNIAVHVSDIESCVLRQSLKQRCASGPVISELHHLREQWLVSLVEEDDIVADRFELGLRGHASPHCVRCRKWTASEACEYNHELNKFNNRNLWDYSSSGP